MRVTVRRAAASDVRALAGLRWRWVSGERGRTGTDRDAFAASFAGWAADHAATHLPFLAEVGGEVVAMAWLVVVDRVPTPVRRHRRSGDIQSVYVVPESRGGGIGAALLDAVLAEARTLGLERVTVHSSDRAVPFYQRAGFRQNRRWLRWTPD